MSLVRNLSVVSALTLFVSSSAAAAVPVRNDIQVPKQCVDGTQPGIDTVLLTLPYRLDQVLPIIDSFKDLTWSGNPPETVFLNGSNNVPGTARFYSLQGVNTVETLMTYERPLKGGGAYYEIHNTAPLQFGDITAYIPIDSTVATPQCNGLASQMNLTAHFCASNVKQAAGLLHSLHMQDAVNVGTMLGGNNFTSCEALMGLPTPTQPTQPTPDPPSCTCASGHGVAWQNRFGCWRWCW